MKYTNEIQYDGAKSEEDLFVGRHQLYLTWDDFGYELVIHNNKAPCGNALDEEESDVKFLINIPYRNVKRLCEVCNWSDKEEAERQLRACQWPPYKRSEEATDSDD